MPDITIITEPAALAALAVELHSQSAIAVDLEADSLYSYREKVCLLQFSTPDRTILVDPLAVRDLAALRPVLADAGVRKIMHAADYDIRCLFRDFQLEMRGLFDTMVCCQFLGEERVGLAAVLAKYCGVQLDKRYQKANWGARPLEAGMIRYAAADTCHLHELADLLEKRLTDQGRRDWAAEEFCLLEQVRHTAAQGPLFLRAKRAWTLTPRQLAILEGLLQWRDQEAKRRDLPLFKVIDTKVLLDLARQAEAGDGLAAVPGMSPRLLDRHGRALAAVIASALARPEAGLPVYPVMPQLPENPAAEARLKLLKKWRAAKAAALGMEAGLVINGGLLEELAAKPPTTVDDLGGFAAMKNWQRRELGPDLLALLS